MFICNKYEGRMQRFLMETDNKRQSYNKRTEMSVTTAKIQHNNSPPSSEKFNIFIQYNTLNFSYTKKFCFLVQTSLTRVQSK